VRVCFSTDYLLLLPFLVTLVIVDNTSSSLQKTVTQKKKVDQKNDLKKPKEVSSIIDKKTKE